MSNILGIDTGGTYTDGALISFPDGRILEKTKTPTLHNNLKKSIESCILGFKEEYRKDISRVCLSTTLATNALVEDRHCPTGLLLTGGVPKGHLPTEYIWETGGKLDIMGREKTPIDMKALEKIAEEMEGKVMAVAVSGYASVRNPKHESAAAEYIRQRLNIPVVCAHELTAELGFYERTVTAVLNAGLIPVICDLIDAVEEKLCEFGIRSPLMIVRGNGMLMSAEQARIRPVETVLSGPAASISGGVFLSGEKDAMILDMGGTTSDMARVREGRCPVRERGARVGGWNTCVSALEVFTCALGGDSGIRVDINGGIRAEAKRVIPYCRAALKYPRFKEEIKRISEDIERPFRYFRQNELEGFYMERDFTPESEAEYKLKKAMADGPHTVYELRKKTELGNAYSLLYGLAERGAVKRIAMTPTDILHASGAMSIWDTETPAKVVYMWSVSYGMDFKEQIDRLYGAVNEKMISKAIEAAFFFDGNEMGKETERFLRYLVRDIFTEHKGILLDAETRFKVPVVAIGAPSGVWTKIIKERLNTEVIVPEHGEVAGAVGAAVGRLFEQERVLIRYDRITERYIVFSSDERKSFDSIEDAEREAVSAGEIKALGKLPEGKGKISVEISDLKLPGENGETVFVERRVKVTAAADERDNLGKEL